MTMLVLSRKTSESISIGPEVKVRILSIRGQRVRLGIEAPREVVILRDCLKTVDNSSTDQFEEHPNA